MSVTFTDAVLFLAFLYFFIGLYFLIVCLNFMV